MPLNKNVDSLDIPTDTEVVLTCRSGNHRGPGHAYLAEQSYANVHNMLDRILAREVTGLEVEH